MWLELLVAQVPFARMDDARRDAQPHEREQAAQSQEPVCFVRVRVDHCPVHHPLRPRRAVGQLAVVLHGRHELRGLDCCPPLARWRRAYAYALEAARRPHRQGQAVVGAPRLAHGVEVLVDVVADLRPVPVHYHRYDVGDGQHSNGFRVVHVELARQNLYRCVDEPAHTP
jgi:hypothetical protein